MDKKEKWERMSEWMRNGCKDKGSMADCCSVMRKMMRQKKRGENKEKERSSKEE